MKESRVFAPKRHPKIAHLSEEELNSMIDEYYEGINLKDIVKKYKLNVHPSSVVNLFPPIIVETKECKYCHIKLWANLKAKSFVKNSYRLKDSYCPACRHIEKENCSCSNCRNMVEKKRIDEHRFLLEKINQRFKLSQHQPISLNELSIREVVYLSTLIRAGLSEDKRYLMIYNFSDFPIAPSSEMLESMVNQLLNRKIIVIHPDSPFSAFEDITDPKNCRIDIYKAVYHVNIYESESNEVLPFFLNPKIDYSSNEKEILNIWRLIAIEECKSYLKFSLDYVDFPYIVSEKAEVIIDNLLNHFSVSQIFGLITRCLGYTTKEFQGGKISRKVAGAYLLGAVQIQGERALFKNWDLSKYKRPQELPESQLSKLFFNNILNIGDLNIYSKIKSI
jgi:hypothetical protein